MDKRIDVDLMAGVRKGIAAQLPAFLSGKRWFGGKARKIQSVEVVDAILFDPESSAFVFVAAVNYEEGAAERYSIPLIPAADGGAAGSLESRSNIESHNGSTVALNDAFSSKSYLAKLFELIQHAGEVHGEKGSIRGVRTSFFAEQDGPAPAPKLLTGEQSNSSVIYGDRLILKYFRRMEEGENPDLEIGRFLTEKARFPHVARIAGSLEYQPQQGKPATQAILQEFVANQGDAWRYALRILSEFYERVGHSHARQSPVDVANVAEFSEPAMSRLLGEIGLLGRRTAELHLALASDSEDAAFTPEPFTLQFQKSLQGSFQDLTARILHLLRARLADIPAQYREKAISVASREQEILHAFGAALSGPIQAMRARIHGDYHLGQVLYTGADFVIIDFEGEPARSLAERRVKQSPLQDVAGMLRSFHYAAFAPLLMPPGGAPASQERMVVMSAWAEAWSHHAANSFLAEYYKVSEGAIYLPAAATERARLLDAHVMAKAVYELGYELNNRPAWVGIPLEGIARLLPAR